MGASVAYGYNWLLFRHRVRYDAYRRILGKLDNFTDAVAGIRQAAIEVGVLQERADATAVAATPAGFDGSNRTETMRQAGQYVQNMQKWTERLNRVRVLGDALSAASRAHEREFFAHIDMFRRISRPYVDFAQEMLALSCHFMTLSAALAVLMQTQMAPLAPPSAMTTRDIEDARQELLAYLNDVGLWCEQLREMLRAVTFPKLSLMRRVAKRATGNPDQRFLSYDGFKTAKELGWYDPRLDTRSKVGAKQGAP